MRLPCVPVLVDQRVLGEHSMNRRPLNPLSTAMNQSNFDQTGFVSGSNVFFDNRGDILR